MKVHLYKAEILNICMENHISVDDIFLKLKSIYPNIGISTIYRNVEELVKSGELKKIEGNGTKVLYEKKKVPHVHLICKKSGKIVDIDMSTVKLSIPDNFCIDDIDIKIYGEYK